MVELRQEKVNRIQNDIAQTEVYGDENGDVLILSWGGTFGSCRSAVESLRDQGKSVSHVHLRWISPLPKDLDPLAEDLSISSEHEIHSFPDLVKILQQTCKIQKYHPNLKSKHHHFHHHRLQFEQYHSEFC